MFLSQLDGDFMLTIGEFSRISRVSAKTLRYYDQTGLLKPGYVSPESGYRYYEVSQLHDMLLISRLKQYQFSLPEIAAVLAKKDSAYLSALIQAKKAELSVTKKSSGRNQLGPRAVRALGHRVNHAALARQEREQAVFIGYFLPDYNPLHDCSHMALRPLVGKARLCCTRRCTPDSPAQAPSAQTSPRLFECPYRHLRQ